MASTGTPFGVVHADMPLTPANVWRAIQAGQAQTGRAQTGRAQTGQASARQVGQ